jgi:hypothetical protein
MARVLSINYNKKKHKLFSSGAGTAYPSEAPEFTPDF